MSDPATPGLSARRLSDVAATAWSMQALPYGIRVEHIQQAMREVYAIVDDMSRPLLARGLGRLEDFMLGNSLSGLISELLVQGLAKTTGMKRNVLVGGFPDLLPVHYPGNSVQDASEGIEVKTTIQPRKLEAHHQFVGDFLLFQYFVDVSDLRLVPMHERWPLEFYGVVIGRVEQKSWWNKVSVGKTGRKTQNTTLKAEYLAPMLLHGTLFAHPEAPLLLARMRHNRAQRKQRLTATGPELDEVEIEAADDLSASE